MDEIANIGQGSLPQVSEIQKIEITKKIKKKLSLYLLHHAEECNKLPRPISASLRLRATRLLSKKCRSGSKSEI